MAGRQVYNPYLPTYEYVPDGEPHVFGDRLYVYGSHDRFDGAFFCLNDYVCWSAPISDLTDWRYEGVIYKKEQDPRNQNVPAHTELPDWLRIDPDAREDQMNPPGIHAMWAPDVVRGPDGRYYLFYCLDWLNEVGVAVCDTPAGAYVYCGLVRHKDGTPLGQRPGDPAQFDPGVFMDDDGCIYLYSGNARRDLNDPRDFMYSQVMRLEPDMLTLAEEPKRLLPDLHHPDPEYAGHEFFEASSIRKVNGRYYLVYSSVRSHELCWAVSDSPTGGFRFGGTLVDIGDVYLNGRTEAEALNALGNTHGGIERVNGQWYVFYHRQTNRTQFSRQGCAEKIYFDADGNIAQAEVTSCGLNDGPLMGTGRYPAAIACALTRGGKAVFSSRERMGKDYPYFTQDMRDAEPSPELDSLEPVQYIANLGDGCRVVYKYFQLEASAKLRLELCGQFSGSMAILAEDETVFQGDLRVESADWREIEVDLRTRHGRCALSFNFAGEGRFDWRGFSFVP